MPELGGMEFSEIQGRKRGLRKVPIIMCTTEACVRLKNKAKETGVVKAWLIKPLISKVLLHAVRRVLGCYEEATT